MGAELKIKDTSAQDVQLAPKSKRARNLVGGGSVLMLLVALWIAIPALNKWSSTSASIPYERLRIAEVVRGDLVRDVSVQGRVVAAVSPTLYAPADGTITLRVEAGASVEKDQVLAVVDSPELENLQQQAQATLEEQDMELERQRIESKQMALEKRKGADLADVALVAARREKRRAPEANEPGGSPVRDFGEGRAVRRQAAQAD